MCDTVSRTTKSEKIIELLQQLTVEATSTRLLLKNMLETLENIEDAQPNPLDR